MKKLTTGLILAAIALAVFLVLKQSSTSPLSTDDISKLFEEEELTANKACSVDFLGISKSGEFFEAFLYEVDNASIGGNDSPDITKWEKRELGKEVIVTKWKKCPLDSLSQNLFKFAFEVADFDREECFSGFREALENPSIYYRYIHINELEQYFFLFDAARQSLFYIRRKGF